MEKLFLSLRPELEHYRRVEEKSKKKNCPFPRKNRYVGSIGLPLSPRQ